MRLIYNSTSAVKHLIYLIIILLTCCLFQQVRKTDCELYSSVDELSRWPNPIRQFTSTLDEMIKFEEEKLSRLNRIRGLLESVIELGANSITHTIDRKINDTNSNVMLNPVGAFITLNRLSRAIEDTREILDEQFETILTEVQDCPDDHINNLKIVFDKLSHHLPAYDDVVGSGKALLRLQTFYGMDINHLVEGSLPSHFEWRHLYDTNNHGTKITSLNQKMGQEDCFELGRIAFHSEQYQLAILWLHKALELSIDNTLKDVVDVDKGFIVDDDTFINDILEYMAFSAFKLGQIEYSAKITQVWLERDPQNDRAIENLQYYLEELEQISNHADSNQDDLVNAYKNNDNLETSGSTNIIEPRYVNLEKYSVSDDDTVRRLCQSSSLIANTTLKCYIQNHVPEYLLYGPIKVEQLNNEPEIIRIHDIMNDKESNYIRKKALPELERSTVQSGLGYQSSEFRIAKTAWISIQSNGLIKRIEDRLSALIGLSMHKSEDFQVVNYGLGGFYGPHLDSARSSKSSTYNNSVPIGELQGNDRLATILLYLNQVEAGGSTVFPRLNLAVTPIQHSAVIWFNLLDSGLSDERTLHTGCPVLLGSKWIATKWPREEANTFFKPCAIKRRLDIPDVNVSRKNDRV